MIWGTMSRPLTKEKAEREGVDNTDHAIDGHDFTKYNAETWVVSEWAFPPEGHSSVVADLMRFLVRMRGARTPPPMMEEPVRKIPLQCNEHQKRSEKTKRPIPPCSEDAESYAETDACRRPHVRT